MSMVTKLTIEYDGTDFAGWARQPEQRTVQEEIERALRTVLGETGTDGQPLQLTVAGRTDRGVHAWGQVASYAHEAVDPRRLNGLLPEDISILSAEPAPSGFDARHDAVSRTYCYRVHTGRSREVFTRCYALWWPHALNREALDACARALRGTHDFTAFTPTETDHVRFERDVLAAEWRLREEERAGEGEEEGEGEKEREKEEGEKEGGGEGEGVIELWITADTFMRHMVRILVGTMLDVATSRRAVPEFEELLQGRPRAQAGPTAPAHGLALARVSYS
jgi:tRNA pseudouridine38-40 synthase